MFTQEQTTTVTTTEIETACVQDGQVQVRMAGCLSSSCDTLDEIHCEAVLDGTTVVVSGSATVTSEGYECTADCGFMDTTCALPAGAEVATTLSWNGGSAPIDQACALN
jgi:hypothetical protein